MRVSADRYGGGEGVGGILRVCGHVTITSIITIMLLNR